VDVLSASSANEQTEFQSMHSLVWSLD
jgi:hypothetical protein